MNENKNRKGLKIALCILSYVATILITLYVFLLVFDIPTETLYAKWLVKYCYDGEYNKEVMLDNELGAIFSSLEDDHSYYIPQEIGYQLFNEDVMGAYGGIGVEIQKSEDGYCITKVFENGPAHKAGVLEGDRIVSVDGTAVDGDMDMLTKQIRGEIGSNVSIDVLRNGERKTFSMARAQIEAPSVYAKMIEDGIGYLEVSQFDSDTDRELRHAIESLGEVDGIIVDLRNNPGGLLQVCLGALDLFVEEGSELVVAKYREKEVHYRAENKKMFDMPMVVLVNGNSASSSEIFSACIKDLKRGTIVGTKTYGKGSIQRTFLLPRDTGANLTIGHFYSPNGVKIDKVGVLPDVVIKADEASEDDVQCRKAIELLQNEKK